MFVLTHERMEHLSVVICDLRQTRFLGITGQQKVTSIPIPARKELRTTLPMELESQATLVNLRPQVFRRLQVEPVGELFPKGCQ